MTRQAPGPAVAPVARADQVAHRSRSGTDRAAGARGERPRTIIQPPPRRPTLGLAELWRYRSIVAVLTRRNLMVRYRQTLIGVGWVLVQPLALMLVFTVFFGLIGRVGHPGVPYPIFFLCGLWIWLPMMKVINEGTVSLITNLQLVTRIYVPRALIPLSVAASTLVDVVFLFIALEVVLLFFGYFPTERLVALPVIVAVGYVTVLGITYLLAALNTRYRDAQLLLPFLIQLWFFITPIVYPASWIPPAWEPVYYLNPMALVVTGSRWIFADMPPPPEFAWPLATLVSALSLIGGYLYFRHREPTFADDL
jgi:lipopolysaccharide transport system permease protein